MNALHFYYWNTVLGVSSFIQPQKVRSTYRMTNGSIKEPDLLFFCTSLNNKEYKTLLQKMAKALGSDKYIIVEILNPKTPHTPLILKNLLTRFLPKSFIIFNPDSAFQATDKPHSTKPSENHLPSPLKIRVKIPLGNRQHRLIQGCLLNPISDFIGPDLAKVHKNKKQTWNILKEIHPR